MSKKSPGARSLQRLVSLRVGDSIEWTDAFCPVRGGIRREGTILSVRGNNIELDMLGTRDWRDRRAMHDVKVTAKANHRMGDKNGVYQSPGHANRQEGEA